MLSPAHEYLVPSYLDRVDGMRGRLFRKTALRILQLVESVPRDPFTGAGKPEPLKFYLQGCWSRRVTQEHRLVYLVRDDRIDFLQARYHY